MDEQLVRRFALGRAMKEQRARCGISQEELGNRCGLHRNYIGALERAEVNATLRVVEQAAGGLGITLAALFELRDARLDEVRQGLLDGKWTLPSRTADDRK